MQDVIDRIKNKNDERDLLIRTLEMWGKVKSQGHNPENVDRFAFDYKLMTGNELLKLRRRANHSILGPLPFSNSNPFGWPEEYNTEGSRVIRPRKFNVLVMKNGDRIKLDPMIDAP